MKNILHVNYSKSGGAGRVAQLLANGQNKILGYESTFINKINGDLWNNPLQDIKLSVRAGIDNFLIKENSFKPLFTLVREVEDKKLSEIALNHEGILHLHWINGIFTARALSSDPVFTKPLVWTIHDMAPITGGCHYSLDCQEYLGLCEACPAVKKQFRKKVSQNKNEKNSFFRKKQNLSIVVPSEWLAKKFEKNKHVEFQRLTIIPNPVEEIFFKQIHKLEIRDKLNLPKDAFIIGFVSQKIENPLKNFDLLLSMLESISSSSDKPIAILGIGESNRKYKNLDFRVFVTGAISNPDALAEHYAAVDVMVSTSLAETFGMSVIEAAALGIPSIVFQGTATEEIIENYETGFIVQSEKEFVLRIGEIIDNSYFLNKIGENARLMALKQFRIDKIVNQYDKIYNDLKS